MTALRYRAFASALPPFLEALYSSPTVDGIQTACAAFAEKLMPADAYGWYLFRPNSVEPTVVSARGVTDRFLELYEKEGRARDPLFQRLNREHRAICSDIDLDEEELSAFGFQSEISSGFVTHAIEAPLLLSGEVIGTINVARNPTSPRFDVSDVRNIATIARHASAAISRVRRESELNTRCKVIEASLNAISSPVVVTDPDGAIIFANRSAEWLLQTRGKDIGALLSATSERLANESQSVVSARIPQATQPPRPSRRLHIFSELTIQSVRLDRAGAIVSFFRETGTKHQTLLKTLSSRERQIAEFVVRGLNNVQIAIAASISRNTVKQHLKHVFEKCEVTSRAELAALVAENKAANEAALGAPPGITFPGDRDETPSSVGSGLWPPRKRP